MNPILKLTVMDLAKQIKEQSLKSEEVVKAFIDQIKKVNPAIHALVQDRFDEAILEARAVDKKIKAGLDEDLPLLGVPCTIKEMLSLKGMPLSAGLYGYRNRIAEQDGTATARLKKAGAIPLGVTNIPAAGMFYETSNPVYGRTNNPHNLNHIPGGSSGGEGALISSAGSAFGLGSDIGGSIRMPAGFCGIFGHKPSSGIVPATGHFPWPPKTQARQYLGLGPLTRYASDIMPILKVLAGPDGYDDACEDVTLADPDEVDITKLNFYWTKHSFLHPDVEAAQKKVIEKLTALGATVNYIDIPQLKHAYNIFEASLMNAMPDALTVLGGGTELRPMHEAFLKLSGQSEFPWYLILIAMGGKFQRDHLPSRIQKYYELGESMREDFNQLLGKNGVLLVPTHPHPAVKHGAGLLNLRRVAYTGIFNIYHAAATAIPVGLSRDGLPLSMQAIAVKDNDHLTIAVACALEKLGYNWLIPELAE